MTTTPETKDHRHGLATDELTDDVVWLDLVGHDYVREVDVVLEVPFDVDGRAGAAAIRELRPDKARRLAELLLIYADKAEADEASRYPTT
jgi:hypothetical protein